MNENQIAVTARTLNLAHALRHDRQVQTDGATRGRVYDQFAAAWHPMRDWNYHAATAIDATHRIFETLDRMVPEGTTLDVPGALLRYEEAGWRVLEINEPKPSSAKRPTPLLRLPAGVGFMLRQRVGVILAGEPAYEMVPLPFADTLRSLYP